MRKFDVKIAFVGVLILIAIRLFSCIVIPDRVFDYLGMLGLMIVIYINGKGGVSHIKMNFTNYVKAIMVLTLISAIPAYLFHDQSFLISFLASRTVFYWLLYFLLHKLNVDIHKLTKLLVYLGVIWASLMVIQQFTFPTVWFTVIPDTDADSVANGIDQRGGLIRIFVQGTAFGYFSVFYLWRKLLDSITVRSFFIFGLTCTGLFLTGSRQIIFGLILLFLLDFIFSKRITNKKGILLMVLMVAVISLIAPYIIGYLSALVNLSEEQGITSSDYIRMMEIKFFVFDYWPHWSCYLIGNGWEHSWSSYGKEMESYVNETLYFFRSDIGLLGAFNKFGLFYVLVAIFIYCKIIIPSKQLKVPHDIRLFFIFCLFTSFTGGNYFELTETLILFCCTFYLIDRYNAKNFNNNTYSSKITYNAARN